VPYGAGVAGSPTIVVPRHDVVEVGHGGTIFGSFLADVAFCGRWRSGRGKSSLQKCLAKPEACLGVCVGADIYESLGYLDERAQGIQDVVRPLGGGERRLCDDTGS